MLSTSTRRCGSTTFTGEERWPRLRAVWAHCPVVAAMGVPVVAAGEKVGCLNCYSPTRGAFTRSQEQAAEVLALAAGVALEAVEENTRLRTVAAQLDQAMASRAVIDQAKGIVMARRGCTADEAFAHLAALSQQRNVKVRDLARALVRADRALRLVRQPTTLMTTIAPDTA